MGHLTQICRRWWGKKELQGKMAKKGFGFKRSRLWGCGILPGNESTIDDRKRLPVRHFLEDRPEPQQFVFDEKWHNLGKLHLFLFTVSKAG